MDSEHSIATLAPLRAGRFSLRRALVAAILAGYGAWLLFVTLTPGLPTRAPLEARLHVHPFETIAVYLHKGGAEMMVNVVGNVVAFVPLGLLWALLREGRTGPWRVTLLSAGVSLLIETLQFVSQRRVTDVDDVFLNTIGGVLGYFLYRALRGLRGRITDVVARRTAS
jgi:glycopeptide antibiotics resistance protein